MVPRNIAPPHSSAMCQGDVIATARCAGVLADSVKCQSDDAPATPCHCGPPAPQLHRNFSFMRGHVLEAVDKPCGGMERDAAEEERLGAYAGAVDGGNVAVSPRGQK